MNKFFQRLVIAGAILFGSTQVHAQKFAHFDMDSILNLMPDMKKANDDALAYYKQLEDKMNSMQTELDTKVKEYQDGVKKGTISPLIQQTMENDIQSLQQRIQDFQVSAQNDFTSKKQELVKPIYDKINAAVKQIAKENGYKYVFDSSNNGVNNLLFADPADDIFALVKKKLNIPNTPPQGTGTGTTPGTGTKPAGGGN